MFIKELAKQTGIATKTIRYYEAIGLIPLPQRAENNYREYSSLDAERLRFVVSARSLGFSLSDIAGTPTATWLMHNAGWVYGGLTLISLISLILGLRFLGGKQLPFSIFP
jgi:hypothetical protein